MSNDKENKEQLDPRVQRYERYFEAQKQGMDAQLRISERYDHWLLTLGGGSLAVSLAFLEKIAANPAPSSLAYIGWAWAFLVVSLICGLLGLLASQYVFDWFLRDLVWEYQKWLAANYPGNVAPLEAKPVNRYALIVHFMNWGSLACFIAGVSLLCVFGFKNVNSRSLGSKAETAATNLITTIRTNQP